MDMIFDVNTILTVLRELSSDARLVWIGLLFAVMYIRNIIRNEKMITHIEDKAISKEEKKLEKRIHDRLSSLKSVMYEAMEGFVYADDVDPKRRIKLVRKTTDVSIPASKFLHEHYAVMKEVLFDIILPETIEWIEDHNIAEVKQSDEELNTSVTEFRDRLLHEIRARTGTNADTRDVENSILTYEYLLVFFTSIYSYAQQMRSVRVNYVQAETTKYRVPFSPRLGNMLKKR